MITLEISSADIRLLEVSNGKVIRWASAPLEAGLLEGELVLNGRALGTAVKKLMSSSGMRGSKVVASVGGLYSLSRLVTVSVPLGQPVTQQAVTEAAEAVIPLSAEEYYLSWQAISPGQGGQQVLLVGVPRDVVDSEVRALKGAGINPYILGLKTLAVARAVNRQDAIVLNIGATTFDIILIIGGVAELLHTVSWQPAELSLEERAGLLASAIDMAVNFHNSRNPDSPIMLSTPLFITGQLSGDTALVRSAAAEIAYPVEPLSPPLEYPDEFPVSQYAVNAGLALNAATTPGISLRFPLLRRQTSQSVDKATLSVPDMNLLPQTYRAWRPSAKQVSTFLATAAVLAMFFPVYQATSAAMRDTAALRQRYAAVNAALEKRKLELNRRTPLQKAIANYNSLVAEGGHVVGELEAIRKIGAETGVALGPLTYSGGDISFDCQAPDYIAFRNFINVLQRDGRFKNLVVPSEGYPYVKSSVIRLTAVSK